MHNESLKYLRCIAGNQNIQIINILSHGHSFIKNYSSQVALSKDQIAVLKNHLKQLSVVDSRAESVQTKKTATNTNEPLAVFLKDCLLRHPFSQKGRC